MRYVVDPDNPYPRAFTGHIRVVLHDGRVMEERQPHMRGGAQEPLTRAEIEEKFAMCCRHGGWESDQDRCRARRATRRLFDGKIDLGVVAGVRHDETEKGQGSWPAAWRLSPAAGRNIGRAIALALAEAGARSWSTD